MITHKAPSYTLIVDDDDDIRTMLADLLAGSGISHIAAANLQEARMLIDETLPAVIVLDLTLPDGDGMSLCRELRREGCDTAILMLTARGSSHDRINGLEGGADDYLSKPFEPRELVARVRNLLRRVSGGPRRAPVSTRYVRFGPWRLDLIQRRLIDETGRVVMISTAEFDILKRFVESPRIELSREELIPERKNTVHLDRSLDNRIVRLRQKLTQVVGGDQLIVTVRGRGFVLASDVAFD